MAKKDKDMVNSTEELNNGLLPSDEEMDKIIDGGIDNILDGNEEEMDDNDENQSAPQKSALLDEEEDEVDPEIFLAEVSSSESEDLLSEDSTESPSGEELTADPSSEYEKAAEISRGVTKVQRKAKKKTKADHDKFYSDLRRTRNEAKAEGVIGEDGTIRAVDDDFDEDLARLYSIKSRKEICFGTITNITEGTANTYGHAAVRNGDFKILIPFEHMDVLPYPKRGESKKDFQRRRMVLVRNMVGAKIAYIVTHIMPEARMATGDNRIANQERMASIYSGKNIKGEYNVRPGRQVEATVLAVHPTFAYVDVLGYRARLMAKNIAVEFVTNAQDYLHPGQDINVFITGIKRNEENEDEVESVFVSMRDSLKEREQREREVDSIKVGDTYSGFVTYRSKDAIFVKFIGSGVPGVSYIAAGLRTRVLPQLGETVSFRVLKKTLNRRTDTSMVVGSIRRNTNRMFGHANDTRRPK